MPQVVQIQRAPNSWDQAGQTVQQTADNFLKSMLAMGQMQNNNAWRMAEMNMQNQRLADANARQDKQLAAVDARHKEDSAQRLQMHNDTMALHRAQFGLHQQALAEKNYERDLLRKLLDGTNPSAQDNTGLNAAVNEVLSPNWSPLSGGGQQDTGSMYDNGVRAGLLKPLPSMSGVGGGVDTPSPIAPIPTQAEVQLSPVTLDAPKPTNPLYELGQRAGIFPKNQLVKPEAPQYSDSPTATQAETTQQAPQPSMAAPAQAQLPADSGRMPMPSLPEKASIVLQGVPVTVDTFPTAFLAIPAGQRIFDSLKAKQEMLNHQYDLEMKAYNHENKQAGISDINNIGKRFTEESKPFQTMSDSMNRLVTGAMANNAAGDMAMVYSYMKLLDPTSVVRESEYATAENARGVPDTVRNLYNKILEGTRLTPEQKTNFVNLGRQLWDGQSQMQDTRSGYFTNLAKGSGISPDLIVQDFSGPVKKSLSDYENWASGGTSAMVKDADSLINKARGLRK